MTTELHKLKPSTIAPIPGRVFLNLSDGGIYLVSWAGSVYRTARYCSGQWEVCDVDADILRPATWTDHPKIICYPKLPALSFKITVKQMTAKEKTVTRRKNIPRWAQPGRLFMAWDRLHRGGAGKARGLGVFRVVSAVRQGRYACNSCHGPLRNEGGMWYCPIAPGIPVDIKIDNLTPAELAAEGFPEMSADSFWSMLEKAGNVRDDGTVCRLQFESV